MKNLFLLLCLPFFLAQCKSDYKNNESIKPVEKHSSIISDEFDNVPGQLCYAIIATSGKQLRSNKDILKNFNNDNGYPDLRANMIYLGTGENKISLIALRRFQGIEDAEAYCKLLRADKIGAEVEHVLPIDQNNYRRLLKNKDLAAYLVFYKKYIAD